MEVPQLHWVKAVGQMVRLRLHVLSLCLWGLLADLDLSVWCAVMASFWMTFSFVVTLSIGHRRHSPVAMCLPMVGNSSRSHSSIVLTFVV